MVAATSVATQPVVEPPTAPDQEVDRYEAVRQYSLREILAVWAAAAVPMGLLAWVVAPWLADQLGGDEPLTQALLIVLTAGLIWQFAGLDPPQARAGVARMVAGARRPLAAATARS
jgi:hypothetical protein